MKKSKLVVIALLAIVLIAVGASYYMERTKSVDTTESANGWKTFVNDDPGFAFSYPENWNKTALGPSGNGYQVLAKVVNPAYPGKEGMDVPSEQFLVRRLDLKCSRGTETTFAGRSALDTGWGEGMGLFNYRTLCIPLTDGGSITIDMSASDESGQSVMEQMASTFKFN
jgi:hypothetical protein